MQVDRGKKNLGAVPRGKSYFSANKENAHGNEHASIEPKLVEQISSGFQVLVLMRGAPGSGKSTLARSLLDVSMPMWKNSYGLDDFIYSTDNYFYDARGRYRFNPHELDRAHALNQRKVCDRAKCGWSPIIVDNTNMQLWEMMPYVEIGARYGYLIEILEPTTPWCRSVNKLAVRNQHNVGVEKISYMLNKYEYGTVTDLLKMLKYARYSLPLPQIRKLPPIMVANSNDVETDEKFQIIYLQSQQQQNQQQQNQQSQYQQQQNQQQQNQQQQNQQSQYQQQPHATEVLAKNCAAKQTAMNATANTKLAQFASSKLTSSTNAYTKHNENDVGDLDFVITTNGDAKADNKPTLFDLLKEGISEVQTNGNASPLSDNENNDNNFGSPKLERHRVNCRNENSTFALLRQIYPDRKVGALWDLFEKCNGDADWAVGILLKEDEMFENGNAPKNSTDVATIDDNFYCNCGMSLLHLETIVDPVPKIVEPKCVEPKGVDPKCVGPVTPMAKPQRSRYRKSAPLEIDFRFNDMRGNERRQVVATNRNGNDKDAAVQTDFWDEEEDVDSETFVEVTLGRTLIKQLKDSFNIEMQSSVNKMTFDDVDTNVFIPRSLAKELYMIWVESLNNQLEEQRQKTLREDEHFARLLKIPKYEECKQSPGNVQELLDFEMALNLNKELEAADNCSVNNISKMTGNLADHLGKMKLSEQFPDIPHDTLDDILALNNNSFRETVNVLRGFVESGNVATNGVDLENNNLNQEKKSNTELAKTQKEVGIRATLHPDEAKRFALLEFQEMRNMAAHHSQLKAECYQKSKDAIQKGNSAVASYYSQVANCHKEKIDMYNQRAANSIVEVHKQTQNNPDLIDLHYLHVVEAIICLDLFIDDHITTLRASSRVYKQIFIITGRGLHSVGGVSSIKNKVKMRLKERNLRWTEVNPGLLRIKVFSASRHTKNI